MRSNPDQTMAAYREGMRPRSSAKITRRTRERPFKHSATYPHVTSGPPETAQQWDNPDGPSYPEILAHYRAGTASPDDCDCDDGLCQCEHVANPIDQSPRVPAHRAWLLRRRIAASHDH